MIHFDGQGILLDVEGTTSALAYVHEVLFPYARRHLEEFLRNCWNDPEVVQARERISLDAGITQYDDRRGSEEARGVALDRLCAEVNRLMDADVKATGLKQLQGLIWEQGFRSGELRSHVFSDVPPALVAWNAAGLDVRVFSSGSVAAQRLFFTHTEAGDLTFRFRGHYDTTLGPKREAASYATISSDMQLRPSEILFLSDVVSELDAARAAGLETGLVVRPGNVAPASGHQHATITNFAQVELKRFPCCALSSP